MGQFTATCERRTSSNVGEDRINMRRRFFMDLGVWGGDYTGNAHTDFALVCGRYVLLCSWLNIHGAGRALASSAAYPEPLRAFLSAQSNRGFIVREGRALSPLFDEDSLLVLIPDLHLQLFEGTRSDNFKYNSNFRNRNASTAIESLETEMSLLLDASEAQEASVIQIGDCFEIWEVQARLINDHVELTEWHRSNRVTTTLPSPYDRMYEQHKIVPRNTLERSFREDYELMVGYARRRGLSGSPPVSEIDFTRRAIRIEDQNAIKEAIMGKYPSIFSGNRYGSRMRFMWIQGNHDNMLANNYYSSQGFGYQISAAPSIPFQRVLTGCEQCVWAEHGHRRDIYNNNNAFDALTGIGPFRLGGGYGSTKSYTLGDVVGEQGFHEGSFVRWLGDVGYDMRPPQLRRAREIFRDNAHVRLVVMGHTHAATLFDWDEFEACRAEEWESFIENAVD